MNTMNGSRHHVGNPAWAAKNFRQCEFQSEMQRSWSVFFIYFIEKVKNLWKGKRKLACNSCFFIIQKFIFQENEKYPNKATSFFFFFKKS